MDRISEGGGGRRRRVTPLSEGAEWPAEFSERDRSARDFGRISDTSRDAARPTRSSRGGRPRPRPRITRCPWRDRGAWTRGEGTWRNRASAGRSRLAGAATTPSNSQPLASAGSSEVEDELGAHNSAGARRRERAVYIPACKAVLDGVRCRLRRDVLRKPAIEPIRRAPTNKRSDSRAPRPLSNNNTSG